MDDTEDIFALPGEKPRAKFPLGLLVITTNAAKTISPEDAAKALARHGAGDWGDLDDADRAENELSLVKGFRLFSAYHDKNGVKFWIITERDRSATTLLLPEDY
jgi:hypothetical protein